MSKKAKKPCPAGNRVNRHSAVADELAARAHYFYALARQLCRGGADFAAHQSSVTNGLSSGICAATLTAASTPSELRTWRIALSFETAIMSLLSRPECRDAAFTGANGPK